MPQLPLIEGIKQVERGATAATHTRGQTWWWPELLLTAGAGPN